MDDGILRVLHGRLAGIGAVWDSLTEADQGSMCFVKSRSRNSQTIENIADDNQNACGTAPLSASKTLA